MYMHQKPNNRRTFDPNAEVAWYVAPCLKHHRTFIGHYISCEILLPPENRGHLK